MTITKHPAKKEKLRYSQSLGKDVKAYLSKEKCGLELEDRWIKGNAAKWDNPSKSMKHGIYFEWITFKNLPKSGVEPKPEFQASKINEKRKNAGCEKLTDQEIIDRFQFGPEKMYEGYATAHANSKRTLAYFEAMGIEIIAHGERLLKGDHEGTIDIRVRFTKDLRLPDGSTVKAGTEAIIDCKYSGLIEDKWSKHGWALEVNLVAKEYHGLQAKEYHYLSGLPVFFYVKDPGDNDLAIFWKAEIDQFTVQQHLVEAKDTLGKMELFKEIGFEPFPELARCMDCPLKLTCQHKKLYPEIKVVNLSVQD